MPDPQSKAQNPYLVGGMTPPYLGPPAPEMSEIPPYMGPAVSLALPPPAPTEAPLTPDQRLARAIKGAVLVGAAGKVKDIGKKTKRPAAGATMVDDPQAEPSSAPLWADFVSQPAGQAAPATPQVSRSGSYSRSKNVLDPRLIEENKRLTTKMEEIAIDDAEVMEGMARERRQIIDENKRRRSEDYAAYKTKQADIDLRMAKREQEIARLNDQIRDAEPNPNRWWYKTTGGSRAKMAVLGIMASIPRYDMKTGNWIPGTNSGWDTINGAIEQDLKAQEAAISNKKAALQGQFNLLQHLRQQGLDARQSYTLAESKLKLDFADELEGLAADQTSVFAKTAALSGAAKFRYEANEKLMKMTAEHVSSSGSSSFVTGGPPDKGAAGGAVGEGREMKNNEEDDLINAYSTLKEFEAYRDDLKKMSAAKAAGVFIPASEWKRLEARANVIATRMRKGIGDTGPMTDKDFPRLRANIPGSLEALVNKPGAIKQITGHILDIKGRFRASLSRYKAKGYNVMPVVTAFQEVDRQKQ